MKNTLTTFIFINNERAISPPLVTVREYARWLETVYDEYTCNYELYLKANIGDVKVLEFHPGTRIGQYFDNTTFKDSKYDSWYIYQDSTMMQKLNRLKLAEYKDVAPIQSGEKKGLRLLRLYSIHQIDLYVRTKIDRTFNINNYIIPPKKIVLKKYDMKNIIIPQTRKVRRSLLDTVPISMTVADIEKQLGHRVSIIS